MVLVLTGAPGTGKTTLANFLISNVEGVKEVVETTNRPRNSEESPNYPYNFVSGSEYSELVASKKLIHLENKGIYSYGVDAEQLKTVKDENITVIRCGTEAALSLGEYFAENKIRSACIYMHCRPNILLQRLDEKDRCHNGECPHLTHSRLSGIYENHSLNFSQLYNHGITYRSYGKVVSLDSGRLRVDQYTDVLTQIIKYLDPSNYASRITYLYLPLKGEYDAA